LTCKHGGEEGYRKDKVKDKKEGCGWISMKEGQIKERNIKIRRKGGWNMLHASFA
jgi:hypothetical protein